MRRRFVLSLGTLFCAAVVIFVSLWSATRPVHRINNDSIEKIKNSMALEQVEAILGAPAGDYSTRKVVFWACPGSCMCVIPDDERAGTIWTSNEAQVDIHFDDKGCVVDVQLYSRHSTESSWAMLCRWIKFGR